MSKELLNRIIENVSQNNPECLEDEVLISNLDINNTEGLRSIRWNTKRIGSVAYTRSGEIAKKYIPVFVKKQEILDNTNYQDK